MINWINSHKQAIKYIWGITKNNNSDNKFHDEKYDGIKNEPTPLRIFKSKKPKSTTFIIFPGASPFAEEHPGMIKLATAILNLGYNVFIPRIPPLKKLNITDENIEWFIKAYIEIINRKDVDKNNISVVGISFGGSILLKAILDQKMMHSPPKSILIYGSCFNFESGLNFLLTGEIEHNGKIIQISPNDWGLTVLFHNFLNEIDIGFDTSKIEKVLAARVADKLDEVETLKLELNEHDLKLTNSILNAEYNNEIEKIAKIIIKSKIDTLNKISPSSFCHKIMMKVFIMHGANDSMVPYTESIKLSQAIPNNELLISYLYEHKEISTNSGLYTKLKEIIKLEKFFASYFKINGN